MIQIIHSGICASCLRPYKRRYWNTEEFVKQNPDVWKVQIEWHAAWLHSQPSLQSCPLNCKWVVEFDDDEKVN